MLNSVALGRKAAIRALGVQAMAVLVAALIALSMGGLAAVSVAVGGSAAVLGSALAAFVALGGGVSTARSAFARLLIGTGLKWLVVITIFAVASGVGRMAPLPLLAGLAVALAAYLLALNIMRQDEL